MHNATFSAQCESLYVPSSKGTPNTQVFKSIIIDELNLTLYAHDNGQYDVKSNWNDKLKQ